MRSGQNQIKSSKGTLVLRMMFFITLFILIIFLRLPTLSESFCDPDLGTPAYASRLVMEGHCPYTNAVFSKPPGSILLYRLVFSTFGFKISAVHLMALVFTFLNTIILFHLGRRYSPAAGFVVAALYSFYQAEILSGGICANFEFWSILPSLVSLALVTRKRIKIRHAFFAGAAACLACWMKQTCTFFLVASFATLLFNIQWSNERDASKNGPALLTWFASGVVACSLVLLLSLGSVSCVESMLDALRPTSLFGYLKAYRTFDRWEFASVQWQRFFRSNLFCFLFVSAGIIASCRDRKILKKSFVFPGDLLYLVAAAASIFAGGRFYGHYFIVFMPFLCLVSASMFHRLWAAFPGVPSKAILISIFLVGTLVDSRPELKFACYSASSLLRSGTVVSEEMFAWNRNRQIGQTSYSEILNHLEWQPTYKEVADYLDQHLKPDETIWCFDYFPEIYFYAQRFSPTRHQENFEIVYQADDPQYGLWFIKEDEAVRHNRRDLLEQLLEAPPRYILRYAYDCHPQGDGVGDSPEDWPRNVFGEPMSYCLAKMDLFPELERLLDSDYARVHPPVNDAIDLYRRKDSS